MDSCENTYCVYKHINKINGKLYIGLTRYGNNPNIRWRNGIGYIGQHQNHFYNAIKKYGWDGFEHIIVQNNLSKQEAKDLEIKLIAEVHDSNPELLYNVSPGGDLGCGFKGPENPLYGKKKSPEHVKHMSESRKGKFWGTTNAPPIPVIDLDTKEVFPSIAACAERYGIAQSMIGKVVNHKNYSAHGHHFAKLDEYEKYGVVDSRVKSQRTQLYGRQVHCVETNITYKNVKEAAKETGIPEDSIYYSASHEGHMAYGYHFTYDIAS